MHTLRAALRQRSGDASVSVPTSLLNAPRCGGATVRFVTTPRDLADAGVPLDLLASLMACVDPGPSGRIHRDAWCSKGARTTRDADLAAVLDNPVCSCAWLSSPVGTLLRDLLPDPSAGQIMEQIPMLIALADEFEVASAWARARVTVLEAELEGRLRENRAARRELLVPLVLEPDEDVADLVADFDLPLTEDEHRILPRMTSYVEDYLVETWRSERTKGREHAHQSLLRYVHAETPMPSLEMLPRDTDAPRVDGETLVPYLVRVWRAELDTALLRVSSVCEAQLEAALDRAEVEALTTVAVAVNPDPSNLALLEGTRFCAGSGQVLVAGLATDRVVSALDSNWVCLSAAALGVTTITAGLLETASTLMDEGADIEEAFESATALEAS